jgi:hypothetical protein
MDAKNIFLMPSLELKRDKILSKRMILECFSLIFAGKNLSNIYIKDMKKMKVATTVK